MKNSILFLAFALFLIVSCNSQTDSSTPTDENAATEQAGSGTAIDFHIKTALDGIKQATSDATAENIFLYKDKVEWNQMALKSAMDFCKTDNNTELFEKIKSLDSRLTQVFADTVSSQAKLDEVKAVCSDLDALIKK